MNPETPNTLNKKELADDTVQLLIQFTTNLEWMSIASAESITQGVQNDNFAKLVDGVSVFLEGVQRVREVLGVEQTRFIEFLEKDLYSTMNEVLESYEKKENKHLETLLTHSLPKTFLDWKNLGLPKIARALDT
jgi:hypothetical protein